jgi:hypothetical protein
VTKVRPCKKGCGYPALKGRQFCEWHALMRLSSDEQAAAANRRLLKVPEGARQSRVSVKFWPEGERWCSGCQSFVPTFYCSGSRCKACSSTASHAKRLETLYGIDATEYRRIMAKQGGRCAICRNKPRSIRFAVDHDHQTGEVRGILCKRCNHDLLGGGHDDVEVLFRAIEYLIFPTARRTSGAKPLRSEVLEALEDRLALRERLRAPQPQDDTPAPF